MLIRPTSLRLVAGAAAVLLALSVTSCTEDEQAAQTRPTRSAEPTTPTTTTSTGASTKLTKSDAPLEVTIEQMRGGVPKKKWAGVRNAIRKPIEAWIQGGFLGGRYPRNGFSDAFVGWTPKAAALARKDRRFSTNAGLGHHLVGVVADRQWARLFVFASHGLTGGATANVYLKFTGQKADGSFASYVVKGHLELTRSKNTWRIFGYDLSRTEAG